MARRSLLMLSTVGDEISEHAADAATQLWRDGQRHRAISVAFATERHRMLWIARGIVGDDAAIDVAQDVLLAIWNHPERFDPDRATLGRYMCMAARSAAIDHLRRAMSRRQRETVTVRAAIVHDADAAEEVLDRDVRRRVVDALARIPVEQSILITQAFYGHLSYRRLAEIHGIPEGTVKSRIRRGLTRLRCELVLDGSSSTDV